MTNVNGHPHHRNRDNAADADKRITDRDVERYRDDEDGEDAHPTSLAKLLTRWQRTIASLKCSDATRALLQYLLTYPDYEEYKDEERFRTIWLSAKEMRKIIAGGISDTTFYKASAEIAKFGVRAQRGPYYKIRYYFDERFLYSHQNECEYIPLKEEPRQLREIDEWRMARYCSAYPNLSRKQVLSAANKYEDYVRKKGKKPSDKGLRKWLDRERPWN